MNPSWPDDQADTVNVSGAGLTKVPDLGRYRRVERLYLSYNELRTVPPAVVDLPDLKFLDLRGNPIEEFPQELAARLSLKAVWLDGTQITRLPPGVATWPLTGLSLSGMPPEFAWAESLAAVDPTYLGSLSLGNNPGVADGLDLVGRFTGLKVLHLNSCEIHAVPDSFAALVHLETLSLHDNELQELPDVVSDLPGLRSLVVSKNPGTRKIKAALRKRGVSYVVT